MKYLTGACLALAVVQPAQADIMDMMIDPVDGQLDVSKWLDSAWGFMPVVIPITEPAVGYGLAGAGVFFHEKLTTSKDGNVYLPAVSGVLGLATENGSRALGGFHSRKWDEDNWGYTGILVSGDMNLQVRDADTNQEYRYGLDGVFTSHELSRKIYGPVQATLGYQYSDVSVQFRDLDKTLDNRNAALTVGLDWNRLDNPLSPMQGYRLTLDYFDFSERWGGDGDFSKIKFNGRAHHRWQDWRLGGRLLVESADDETPFYSLPYITLRGVPAMAYIGQDTTSLELELGYQFNVRWSAVAFGGAGSSRLQPIAGLPLEQEQRVHAGGMGFRYLMAREYGLLAGIDLAQTSEGDSAIYFQVGSAWY